MKAYNVKIKNYGKCFWMTWENYAGGKFARKFESKNKALEYLKNEGWKKA